jgi:aminoacyl tRNA synthase complex-interacting multifunctional protein 1
MSSSSSKGALALLNDLILELEENVKAAGLTEDAPKPPKNNVKSASADNKDKPVKEKKKGGGHPPKVEPNPPPKDVETVHALDFRVGVIIAVKKHDTADKLYCEEIDIGEDEPRQIASGLVPHYTVEEMLGKRLIVVANLKPRNLVGFKSYGMVLCAGKPDDSHPSGEKVEFIDPPANAKPGDRILGEGLDFYDPLSSAQVEKQKAWEKVAAKLSVNCDGFATWNGVKLIVQGCEGENTLKAPTLTDCAIR